MRNPNKFRGKALIAVVISVIFSIILINFTNTIAFSILGILAIVAYFILSLIYWTCPNCKKFLPWYSGKIYMCPYCGHQIEKKGD